MQTWRSIQSAAGYESTYGRLALVRDGVEGTCGVDCTHGRDDGGLGNGEASRGVESLPLRTQCGPRLRGGGARGRSDCGRLGRHDRQGRSGRRREDHAIDGKHTMSTSENQDVSKAEDLAHANGPVAAA